MPIEPHSDLTPDLTKVYESIPVSEARSNMAELTDKVAFHRKRVILTKQNKAFAVLMPIGDLESLHALDVDQFQSMHSQAVNAEHEEIVSLRDATEVSASRRRGLISRLLELNPGILNLGRGPEPIPEGVHATPASGTPRAFVLPSEQEKQFEEYLRILQNVIVASCAPAENKIIAGVSSKIENALSIGNNSSAVRKAVAEGVRENFSAPAPSSG
jgi:PHD/YefM family antitoxin component YafN of YafNO toxin-antitoxin module